MRRSLLLAIAAGALALATPALAIMVEVGMQEMVTTSSDIVRGSVTQLNSYWAADRHTIRTDVTLAVAETWKGELASASAVTLTVEGGRVGDVVQQVEDQPDLRPGDDVVLFLQPRAAAAGHYQVTNDFQGRYLVQGADVLGPRLEKLRLSDLRLSVQRLATTTNR